MKMRISKNNLASFLCGGVVCLTACISMGSNDVEKVIESRPVVSSMTLSPDVPSSVPFCGKLIDITRYDMREAYDRELSSFTYFHSTTMLLIKRANRYFPVIEPILKARNEAELRREMELIKIRHYQFSDLFTYGFGSHHLWVNQANRRNRLIFVEF